MKVVNCYILGEVEDSDENQHNSRKPYSFVSPNGDRFHPLR